MDMNAILNFYPKKYRINIIAVHPKDPIKKIFTQYVGADYSKSGDKPTLFQLFTKSDPNSLPVQFLRSLS